MRTLLRYPSCYLAVPMLVSCLATFLTYAVPDAYRGGVYLLAGASVAIIVLDAVVGIRLPPIRTFEAMDFCHTGEGVVALAFAAIVLAFCLVDVALFPIPLIVDPAAYDSLQAGRTFVRHISDMSWVLPPIALLCIRNRLLSSAVILAGFLFPVLVLDRNRLMAALFSLLMVLVLRRRFAAPFPWMTVTLVTLVVAVTFSTLGTLRSGSLDFLTLPFSGFFGHVPEAMKWLLLYATGGVYNFGAILAKGYRNADFLLNQIVPFRGSVATLDTGIPLDAPTINVGTEFLPFLMAFGRAGALGSVLALYAMLLWGVKTLRSRISPFTLLIFLRLAYVCVMSPFAPQAFTWTNFGFLALCLALPKLTFVLPIAERAVP